MEYVMQLTRWSNRGIFWDVILKCVKRHHFCEGSMEADFTPRTRDDVHVERIRVSNPYILCIAYVISGHIDHF